jgi:hypothetical protein
MKMQKLVYASFAAAAMLSASVPALAWNAWPDVDFAWYANVGKPLNGTVVEVYPAPRAGYIWAPGHWETHGDAHVWIAGQFVADDFNSQVATYATPDTPFVDGVPAIRDSQGNVIPMSRDAYPVDSALK